MKKVSKFDRFLSILFVLAFLSIAFGACTQWTEEQKKRQHLPDFDFEGISGSRLTKASLSTEKPVTILFFDPDCSHCKQTIDVLVEEISGFDNTELVLLSPADRTQVLPFLNDKRLLKRENVKSGFASAQEFLDTFGTTTLPTMLFYTSSYNLVRAYKGPVDAKGMKTGIEMAKD